ncbi:hypothetical protein I302_105029 [Kwoniella bestiolae CBS 10118]|uniref:Uncharacterized protein n=1 Tax=Kwoniella bestiolae CBS 10118 TaxID=1296100 RepID=A0A1B9FR30_9TREE|nr:hypothetical protein I302_08897 [Kwoniella bestiolae CBS 10118]OCF21225.1 hypothetical protein I302_08897 [Kwoniella bestiolae CBS 10118]
MSRLSPAAPSFQPSNTPSSLQIRQAYVSGRGRSHSMFTHNPRSSYGNSSFRGRGRFHRSPYQRSGLSYLHTTYNTSSQGDVSQAPPTGGEIIGLDDDENQQAALNFKALLDNEVDDDVKKESESIPAQTPVHPYMVVPPAPSRDMINVGPFEHIPRQSEEADDILKYAFQSQYSKDWRHRDISRIADSNEEEIWKIQNNHLLMKNQVPPFASSSRSIFDTPAPFFKREGTIFSTIDTRNPQYSSEHIRLDGLGGGRSRNEYGRTLIGGQESGRGVIGNTSYGADGDTTVVISGAGCDIPMIREPWFTQPQIPREAGEDVKANIGPHTVSLNPDLPPLAIEHPARVWNSIIHSVDTNLQPVIKWDYEKIFPQEQGQDILWLAELTLVLPSTHPTITEHPLYRTLPKNQWKKEYVAAVEAIGGVKKWVGEPRRLKADAQNTTLVKCIAEDALAWVLAPKGIRAVVDSDDEDEDGPMKNINPLTTANHTNQNRVNGHFQYLHPGIQSMLGVQASQQPTSDVQPVAVHDTNEIKIEEEDLEVIPSAVAKSTDPAPPPSLAASGKTAFQLFMDALHRTLGPGGINVPNPASFASDWEPFTNKFGCTLTLGSSGDIKLYQEPSIHTYAEEAQNAVCQKALDLNVVGFMEWLKETLSPSTVQTTSPISAGQSGEIIVRPPHATGGTTVRKQEVDWQRELAAFCIRTNKGIPKYNEQEVAYEGLPETVSSVTIGGETFSVSKNDRSLREVKQYLARRVLVDHFGCKPKEEEPIMVSTSRL